MLKIIDEALTPQAYNDLLAQIACGPFEDEVNPADGVTYPLICKNIPSSVTLEIDKYLEGEYVEFLRASPSGVHCPHPVHHDGVMGRWSIMLYTCEAASTALVRHKETGCCYKPEDPYVQEVIEGDVDKVDKWESLFVIAGAPNRMAIFDANLMHAALPVGGSGEGATARTVYTRFVK